MQAKDQARTTRRITALVIAVSTIVASGALAGPLPPSCLSTDGSPPDPTGTCCDSTPTAYADENGPPGSGTVIGDLLTSPDTFHSIGFVWDIDGDADHDGSVSVRYRKAGACNFAPAMPLIRNDYSYVIEVNEFAGSLMFLTPGTTYEVVLELSDPDGGSAIRIFEATTRAIPVKPTGGNTYYVTPGSGSGNAGTQGDPFEGLSEANSNASAGDIFLLGSGTYSGRATLNASGGTDNHIVYQEDPADTGAVVEALLITGDFIWIDNLTFTRNANDTAILGTSGASDLVITNNTMTGYFDGVNGFSNQGDRWTVMDNTIVGSLPVGIGDSGSPGNSSGKGVVLGGENIRTNRTGHVIAFNSITRFADGIGIDGNSDTYGNQVWDCEDDAFSSDGAQQNVRVWGNRFHNVAGSQMPFQPMLAGPWYFLYNQMSDANNGIFKFRQPDRAVLINNTFTGGSSRAQHFMYSYMRNNLFLGGGIVWTARDPSSSSDRAPVWVADWFTDIDYDGFDGGSTIIRWFDDDGQTNQNQAPQGITNYSSLSAFAADVGIEANAIEVTTAIFDDYVIDEDTSLILASGANVAVDAGSEVPNLADFYSGSAPDLGAHDRDNTAMPVGPRGAGEISTKDNYWDKH